jgi:glycosyltransferase involved in cell wall biosynthesis
VRVLVSTLTPYPSGSAHVVHITATAQGFVDTGHEVTLASAQPGPGWPAGDAAPDTSGLTIRTLAGRDHRGQSLVNGLRLWRLARTLRPALCFADDVRSALAVALTGTPVLVELHSMAFHGSRSGRAAFARLVARPELVAVVTISEALRDDVITAGTDGALVVTLPEAARPRSDAELAAAPPDWLRPTMRVGALQVGYSGSLYDGRGVTVLEEVARRLPDVDVHVLGGPAAVADALRSRTDRPANLHVHGLRPPSDAARLQAAMDVLLAPYGRSVATPGGVDTSRWMSPMKVFEYLAAGRSTVCSDLPVLREVLDDGGTALLVDPDDVDGWVAAVGRLRDDPALRERLGAEARRVHAEWFTWDRRTRRMLDLAAAHSAAR